MKSFRKMLLTAGLLTLSFSLLAETVVVVHPSVRDNTITKDQAGKIFLGKSSSLPSGHKVIPIDQDEDSQARVVFYDEAAGKNPSQLTAYWARLVFSGKAQPPKTVLDDEEVKELVANNPSVIGYMDKQYADKSVKIIMTLK
jgi:ABC-type phosphate transport system substrate-binding protein